MTQEELNDLSKTILDAAISVHKEMGPGLLEGVYQQCLVKELIMRDVKVNTMVPVPLHYKGQLLNKDYVIDILVADEIILELKAVEGILPVHEAQIISYLKLASKRLGFPYKFQCAFIEKWFQKIR
jgi:GxxExxY protein